MATRNAVKSGNWSDPTVWDTGVPVDGDTANAATYTVRFDVDINQPNTLLTATSGYFYWDASGERIVTANANAGTHTSGGLIRNSGTGTLTFSGEVKGGSGSSAYGANNNSAGTLNVTTATGGSGTYAYGAFNNSAGTLNITTATGGSGTNAYGANNNSAGTLICDLAVGSGGGVGGAGSMNPGVYGNGAAGQTTKVRRIQFGPYGCYPVQGAILLEDHATNSAQFRTAYGGDTKTLTDAAASADFPATSDVRYGVAYDNGDKTGTCYVPDATNVAYGVPVDDTTGTAVLTADGVSAAVWDEARGGHTTSGTYGAVAEWAGNVDEAAIAAATLVAMNVDPPAVNVTYSAGVALGGRLAEASELPDVSALATEATAQAILEDTGTTLPAAIAAIDIDTSELATAAALAVVDGIVDAIKAKTDLISADGSVSVTSAISGSTITILRGDTLSVSIAGLGDISDRSKLWFTAKAETSDADTSAIIQIEETDGLVRLNGAAGTAVLGDITVTDEAAGNITITLDETATDDLVPRRNMSYDVQMLTTTGAVTTLTSGTLHVTADVTRAVA